MQEHNTDLGQEIFPLQIHFKDIDESDFIHNAILQHAQSLKKFHSRIISGHVTVSLPHRRHTKGNIYHIQIRLHVPGGDVVVSSEPEKNDAHEDAYVAIHDAFAVAKRQLEEFQRRQRGR